LHARARRTRRLVRQRSGEWNDSAVCRDARVSGASSLSGVCVRDSAAAADVGRERARAAPAHWRHGGGNARTGRRRAQGGRRGGDGRKARERWIAAERPVSTPVREWRPTDGGRRGRWRWWRARLFLATTGSRSPAAAAAEGRVSGGRGRPVGVLVVPSNGWRTPPPPLPLPTTVAAPRRRYRHRAPSRKMNENINFRTPPPLPPILYYNKDRRRFYTRSRVTAATN